MKNWQKILLSLMIIATLSLLIINPALLVMYVVQPVARVLWLIYGLILMIDQVVYWGLLAVGVLILLLRMIPGRQDLIKRATYLELTHQEDRQRYWSDLINRAPDNLAAHSLLRSNLDRLVGETNSFLDEQDGVEFDLSELKRKKFKTDLIPGIGMLVKKFMLMADQSSEKQLNHELDHILSQLESKLEIPNEE